MPRITIGYGIALILLGVGMYFVRGQSSLTALIPAAFGVVLAILGVVGKRPAATKHAMHAAAAVGLLGLLGTARGLGGFFTLLAGGSVELPLAAIAIWSHGGDHGELSLAVRQIVPRGPHGLAVTPTGPVPANPAFSLRSRAGLSSSAVPPRAADGADDRSIAAFRNAASYRWSASTIWSGGPAVPSASTTSSWNL